MLHESAFAFDGAGVDIHQRVLSSALAWSATKDEGGPRRCINSSDESGSDPDTQFSASVSSAAISSSSFKMLNMLCSMMMYLSPRQTGAGKSP